VNHSEYFVKEPVERNNSQINFKYLNGGYTDVPAWKKINKIQSKMFNLTPLMCTLDNLLACRKPSTNFSSHQHPVCMSK